MTPLINLTQSYFIISSIKSNSNSESKIIKHGGKEVTKFLLFAIKSKEEKRAKILKETLVFFQ